MRLKLVIIVFSMLLVGGQAFAVPSLSNLVNRETYSYQSVITLKNSGNVCAKSTVKVNRQNNYFRLEAKRQDIVKEKGNVDTVATSEYILQDATLLLLSYRQFSYRNKKLYIESSMKFDWGIPKGDFFLKDYEQNKVYQKSIAIEISNIPVQVMAEYLTEKIRLKVSQTSFRLTFPTGDSIKMKAEINYQPVKTTAFGKEYLCYTVELKPDFGFISGLIPSAKYYYSSQAPFRLIRYEGTQGGPGSPDIIQEFSY